MSHEPVESPRNLYVLSMRIKQSDVFVVETGGALPKDFVFCRLVSDDGTAGWGEAYSIPHRERGIAEFTRSLCDLARAIGEVTPQIFRQQVAESHGQGHHSIDFSSAVSVVEVALWDLLGKRTGKPVCKLLGSVTKRVIPLYANMDPLSKNESVEQLVERCRAIRQQGFDALKIYPMEYGLLEDAVTCVRRVREAIGAEARLLIDLWALDDADEALQAESAFAGFDPFWLEEPIAGERIREMAEIRAVASTPIVTGERQIGTHHFQAVLQAGAADILNPDIVAVGGLQDILEIGELAESFGAGISPHCWNSPLVATAAMIHCMAVLPTDLPGEYFPQYASFFDSLGRLDMQISNGNARLGDVPGLGVEMNDEVLARFRI